MSVKRSADGARRPIWRRGMDFTRGVWREFHDAHGRSARNVTKANSRRAYQKLYAADDLLAEYLAPERMSFYEEVAALAAPYARRSVVDVGCGSGNLLRAVLDRTADRSLGAVERILALDYARSALDRVTALVPEAEVRLFDIMREDIGSERFDLVLCTEVLEHVRRPQLARDRLASACAVGGTILITVPDGAIDEWEGHANFWDADELRVFLEPIGATTVQRIESDGGLLALVKPAAETRDELTARS